jgi:uncharacterized membrane protein/YHS domain-containing protein
MARRFLHLLILALLLAGAGAASAQTRNLKCPVEPDEETDPTIHLTYQGREIYFCCDHCPAKFTANPGAYLANLDSPPPTPPPTPSVKEDDDEESEGLVGFLGRFHVLVVHFPVALLIVAALSELLALLLKSHRLADFTRFNLTLGAATAVAAAILGWLDAWGMHPTGERADLLLSHRWLGTGTALLATLTFLISWLVCLVPHPRLIHAYRIFVFATAILVAVAAHFGGRLVFGSDYFSW